MNYSIYSLIATYISVFIYSIFPARRLFIDVFWPGRQELLAARIKATRNAVKTQLVPFIAELGFKENHKTMAGDGSLPPLGNTYSRQRGEFFDEIHFQWNAYGCPSFAIEFWTDQTERMIIPGSKPPYVSVTEGEYYARIPPRLPGRREPREIWYGQDGTLSQAMITAKKRLLDLDEYLRTGATSAPLSLVPMVVMGKDRLLELFPLPPPPGPPTLLQRFDMWVWRNMWVWRKRY